MYAKLGEKLAESANGAKSDDAAPKRKAADSPGKRRARRARRSEEVEGEWNSVAYEQADRRVSCVH